MAKTLEEYLRENPNMKFSQADMELGRNNFGALEQIIQARKEWNAAATAEAKKAANNKANAVRQYYGGYSGGSDGMEGKYSPTYVKPSAADKDANIEALYNKFNSAYKNPAPTWSPKYEKEIAGILDDLQNREAFSYDMNSDPLYQQYRDQYIREGQRAMQDTAAQTAALTGGYGSTYGSIAAQQGYDNYLAGLNDRVPQLEQAAYGKYSDELADMYNRMGALQGEEQRLYSQYLDAMGQYNTERNFSYNAMQAAMGQNNYENEFDRNIFESDRGYNQSERQAQMENALLTGDYRALKEMGYDTDYLDFMQQVERTQGDAAIRKATAEGAGGRTGRAVSGRKVEEEDDSRWEEDGDKEEGGNTVGDGYTHLVAIYSLLGDTEEFEDTASSLIATGTVTEADYDKFLLYKKK